MREMKERQKENKENCRWNENNMSKKGNKTNYS